MRCLYCGKELALLKRWTGSGEFCSDAHRQRYQEEYNQLALNRLLQAKPPSKSTESPESEESEPAKPLVAVETANEATAYRSTAQAPAPAPTPEPVAEPVALKISEVNRARTAHYEPPAPPRETIREIRVEEPVHAEVEIPAPATTAGFFVQMPDCALAEVSPMSRPDLEFLNAVVAALPNRSFEPLNDGREAYQLETAGLVTFEPSNRASSFSANGTRNRQVEVRDFVRTLPIVEIALSAAGETGLEGSKEALDILISPQSLEGTPVLWQEAPRDFPEIATELGLLARLCFSTTGYADDQPSRELDPPAALIPEPPPVAVAEFVPELLEPVQDAVEAPPEIEPAPEPEPEIVSAEAAEPEPVVEPVVEAAVEPVVESVVEAKVEPVVEKIVEPVVEAEVEPAVAGQVEEVPAVIEEVEKVAEAALPEPMTVPLPLNQQPSAPSKGKPVQVFSSIANSVQPQAPRATSLPLRPVMIFGPAPSPAKIESKSEPKSEPAKIETTKVEPKRPTPAPVRPDPRLATGKLRGVAAEVQEDVKPSKDAASASKQAAKAEAPVASRPSARLDPKQDKKPEAKEPVRIKEEQKPTSGVPTSSAPPYSGSSDLGLPHLNLQSSGFLGQIPMVAKIGIVIALVAGLGAFIAFSSKSGGAATTGAGTIVAGSALPSGEAGWITDWGASPGQRSTRQISILRSSQTLTDYRIDMNGQIESKALGWVFRAQDPKNFYVTKLEIVKPGLEPTVALVRFAIINGEEQAHAQLPLPMKVRLDTMYKIRFDAVGDHFTTYVQDQKVDDWTDDHVKTGGVGFYRERGEDATLKGGMNVVPLMVKK